MFDLLPGSPAIDAGLDLRPFGIAPATRDLRGTQLKVRDTPDAGALEHALEPR
jgi:hypothetical protein